MITILAVAGILVIPAVQPALDATRTQAGVRKTAAFLDNARRIAVLARKTVVVHCRPNENQLELEAQGVELEKHGIRGPFSVPAPLTLAACRPEAARYLPQGGAEAMELTLRDTRGGEHAIKIGAFTGLARIQERR